MWPPGVHHTFALSLLLLLFNCQVVSDSLRPHGLRHTWLPCPSSSPRICPNLCPLNSCVVTIPPTHHIQPQPPSPVRSFQPHSALERMCPISIFHVSVLPICTRCPLSMEPCFSPSLPWNSYGSLQTQLRRHLLPEAHRDP